MPDATPAAPAAPAARAASQTTTDAGTATAKAAPVSSGQQATEAQPKPQETAPAKTAEQADVERRSAALARVKRESAELFRRQQEVTARETAMAGKLKLADDYERLQKLRAEDPVKFAEEIGLSIPDLSKRFIEKSTGHGRSPAELVKEEVDRRLAEDGKARAAAEQKAQQESDERSKASALAGALKQMESIAKSKPDEFEHVIQVGEPAINAAWKLCVDFHAENSGKEGYIPLAFDKALAAIEAREEAQLTNRLKSGKKGSALIERLRAEQAEKAKQEAAKSKQSLSAKPRSTVEPSNAETEPRNTSSPTKKQTRLSPTRMTELAKELWDSHAAKRDN